MKALLLTLLGVVAYGQTPAPTPPPSKKELKRQKKEEEEAAAAATRAAREAADHASIPLASMGSQTPAGQPGCASTSEMTFHRDVVRGWGGLLGGGNNAFLGVTSSLEGVVNNACDREVSVTLIAEFYNSSGLQLGLDVVTILVPAARSNSFKSTWSCPDGSAYTLGGNSVWIPNCAASTGRYRFFFQ
jgi:hypothetical protein